MTGGKIEDSTEGPLKGSERGRGLYRGTEGETVGRRGDSAIIW